MSGEDFLRRAFVSLEVGEDFTAAGLLMGDGSRLEFCHRVGERWARAAGPGDAAGEASLAGQVLARVARFRLNRRHLEVWFDDGSRWEALFGDAPGVP
jgi:hypothetical protein